VIINITAEVCEMELEAKTEDGLMFRPLTRKRFPHQIEYYGLFWALVHVDPTDRTAFYVRD
jgi:hypothetical protein